MLGLMVEKQVFFCLSSITVFFGGCSPFLFLGF